MTARPPAARASVLAGGVGAARFLRGLVGAVDPATVTAVVNTGDDTELHGLSICPDLDTITYTLAGATDRQRGWGLAGETWATMGALARYAEVRPDGSGAGATWFNLGDRDLATHLYRTARLGEGASLTDVTGEIASAWGVAVRLLPMTDDRFRTMVTVAGGPGDGDAVPTTSDPTAGAEITFQDYFVRLRHAVAVQSVRFEHHGARPTPSVVAALTDADAVVIAPSNPIVSIGPIRALPGVDELLAQRRESVVAVSPIVGGAALKGPADRMLTELGHEASVVGVAHLYREVAATLVVDHVDAHLADAVERAGMRCVVTHTVMRDDGVATALARICLSAAATR